MKKIILAGGMAAILMTGVAIAAPGDRAARFDPNGDGKVTVAEVQQRSAEHFRKLDANNDGRLTKAEFDAAREQRDEKRAERRAKFGKARGDMFAHMDANGDGAITQAEFSARSTERLQRLDADKDGVISREEFAAARGAFRARHNQAN